MFRAVLVLAALVLGACSGGGVLSFEASRAKLAQHRKAYEWLAADLRLCGIAHLKATGQALDRCAGRFDKATLQSAMITLQIREARLDGGEVRLMTGADSTYGRSMAAPVASWMIHSRYPEPSRAQPLTGAPNHWFYEQHD
ncbi:MAG: hypothetical protein JWR84_1244 [Caulobacter sp.]|nr:hypothetical protein [Caulobacter sp.]